MVAYRVEKGCGVSRSSRFMIIAAAKFRVTSDSQQEHTFIVNGIAKFVRGEHDLHWMDHLEALKLQCEGIFPFVPQYQKVHLCMILLTPLPKFTTRNKRNAQLRS